MSRSEKLSFGRERLGVDSVPQLWSLGCSMVLACFYWDFLAPVSFLVPLLMGGFFNFVFKIGALFVFN